MRKSIAMGVYERNQVRQNFGLVFLDWPLTNTPWVRFWVDWSQLAPYAPARDANGNPVYRNPVTDGRPVLPLAKGGSVAEYVRAIDNQIGAARALGLRVVLTFYGFPVWANGVTATFPPGEWYRQPYHRIPAQDMSQTSAWATYFLFTLLRWSSLNPFNGGAYADFLEVCNEPNLYIRLRGDGTPLHVYAGRQMVTAQALQRATGVLTPILAGPGTLDNDTGPTAYRPFTKNLLSYLKSQTFTSDRYWAWSHHNYRDIRTNTNGRAQNVRKELDDAIWKGWPRGNAAERYVLLTEGGGRVDQIGESEQALRVAGCIPTLPQGHGRRRGPCDVLAVPRHHRPNRHLRQRAATRELPLRATPCVRVMGVAATAATVGETLVHLMRGART